MAKKKTSKKKVTGKKAVKKKTAKKPAKKPTSTSDSKKTVLTADQQKKIRKLLKSKDAKNIKLAVGLLQSTDATADDWSQSFSSTVVSLLVNTWDFDVWNAVTTGLQPFSGLLAKFMGLAAERFEKLGVVEQSSFLYPTLANCEPALSSVISVILSKTAGMSATTIGDKVNELLVSNGFVADASVSGGGNRYNPWVITTSTVYTGFLDLAGLTNLSDAAAACLAKHEGHLKLSGLTELSDGPGHIALSKKLSEQEGSLYLRGLTKLSDAAAENISKHKGGDLFLTSLAELSDAAAESLSKYEGYLDLWLTSLSDAVAESLSKYEGDLDLSGLTKISDAAAKSLGKHKGNLDLWGLTSLSDVAVEALSSHEGGLKLGLTELSVAAAASLGKLRRNLNLDGLTELSVAAATSLGQHKYGHLNLWDLTSLSDAAAEGLAIRKRKLTDSHIRLSELPESAAKILRDAGHG